MNLVFRLRLCILSRPTSEAIDGEEGVRREISQQIYIALIHPKLIISLDVILRWGSLNIIGVIS